MTEVQIGLEEKERDETTFNELAHADASHDFHHYTVNKILEEVASTPLNSKLSLKQRSQNINQTRIDYAKLDIYKFFKDYLNTVLPVDNAPDNALSEENAMKMVGLDYINDIRVPLNDKNAKEIVPLPDKTFEFNNKDGSKIKRKYEIKAVRYRSGRSKIPVAQAFEAVSGKKEFNLIVDAGYISISDLRIFQKGGDESIKPMLGISTGPYTFRFLKSIENDSDSATKITNFENPPTGGETTVDIFFLKDENNVGYFPTFHEEDQAANVFTGVSFETRRMGKKVLASFHIGENENFQIDDLSNSSEKQQASILAMNKYIENLQILSGATKKDDDALRIQREIALHILSKRMGDWCQSICLLDKSREYTPYKLNFSGAKYTEKSGEKVKLIQFPDAETGVLTHDQILLAYSILLGNNVFFTINTANPVPGGGGWLIYFKNKLSGGVEKSEITKIDTNLEKTKTSLDTYITDHDYLFERIKNKKEDLINQTTLLGYITDLYKFLYGITEFTPKKEFESLKTQIENLEKYKMEDKDIDWYISSKFIIEKTQKLIEDNKKQEKLEIPLNLIEIIIGIQDQIIDKKSLVGKTIMMRFIEDIIKPFQERYLQYLQIVNEKIEPKEIDESMIPGMPTGRVANVKINLREVNLKIRSIFTERIKKHRGGAKRSDNFEVYKTELQGAFNQIRQRQILFAKTKGDFKKFLTDQKSITEDYGYFIGLNGDYVRDRHGNYISVIDKYIVTADDCELFLSNNEDLCLILNELYENDLELSITKSNKDEPTLYFYESYLDLRRKLLILDILYTKVLKLHNIFNNISQEIKDDLKINYPKYNLRTYFEIYDYDNFIFLQKIITTFNKLNFRFRENRGEGTVDAKFNILGDINNLRTAIFSEYYSKKYYTLGKGEVLLTCEEALDIIEEEEAAEFLINFSEQTGILIEDIKEDQKEEAGQQKGLISELIKLLDLYKTTGGSRKKRKTRRKSQRIKTTRRKRKSAV